MRVQSPGGMQRRGCEGEVQGRGKQCMRVPTRGRAAPSQTPGSQLRAALPHPFLAEVSCTRGMFPEPRLRQPLSRPRTAVSAPSPEGPRSREAWIRLTMFVLGSFLLVLPTSPARWSHGVWVLFLLKAAESATTRHREGDGRRCKVLGQVLGGSKDLPPSQSAPIRCYRFWRFAEYFLCLS